MILTWYGLVFSEAVCFLAMQAGVQCSLMLWSCMLCLSHIVQAVLRAAEWEKVFMSAS